MTLRAAKLTALLFALCACDSSSAKRDAEPNDEPNCCPHDGQMHDDGGLDDDAGADEDGGRASQCVVCPRPAPKLAFEHVPLSDEPQQATSFVFTPDGEQLFVARKDGRITRYRRADDGYDKLGAFTIDGVWSFNDCGLQRITLDPKYERNGYLYAAGCIRQTANRIWRVTVDPLDDDATEASIVTIITVEEPDAPRPFHNAGGLHFDAEGNLFAHFGDKVVSRNGQRTSNNLGAVLRIVPSRAADTGGYEPAAGNPFELDPDASPDIYAYGLRMPWSGSLDRHGRLWIGDVGSDGFEEIDVATEPGMNFGWGKVEGPCKEDCEGFAQPLLSWSHDDEHPYILDDPDAAPTQGRSVWIAPMYEDHGNDRYDGLMTDRLLFGEQCVGWVRALEVDADLDIVLDAFVGHLETAVDWRQAPDGYLYGLSFGTCGSVVDDPPESRLYRAVLTEP